MSGADDAHVGAHRAGRDPRTTVVNPWGETHDVKHLYVADASLLPTSIGDRIVRAHTRRG